MTSELLLDPKVVAVDDEGIILNVEDAKSIRYKGVTSGVVLTKSSLIIYNLDKHEDIKITIDLFNCILLCICHDLVGYFETFYSH